MFEKSYRICLVDGKAWNIEIFLISKLAVMLATCTFGIHFCCYQFFLGIDKVLHTIV